MTTNNHDSVPRRATTAVQHPRAQHLAGRLLSWPRRERTADMTSPTVPHSTVPQPVHRRVLRQYHATTLAHARHATEELVRDGFNTGDVPYGYRARRVRVTPPNRRPRWRTRLTIEPVEASTVRMIFIWRGTDHLTLQQIQHRLTASRYPAPLNPDTGQPGVWTVPMIRAILRNPKYLGHQIWGRTHHGKPLPHSAWVWSAARAHPPLITTEEYAAANLALPAAHATHQPHERGTTPPRTGPVMDSNYYPDGLTIEIINELQRQVDDELRQQGYPVSPESPTPSHEAPAPTRAARRRRTRHRTADASGRNRPAHDSHAPAGVERRERAA